ncbi:MAG: nitroreductase family protein [Bacteroidetes bacterium]|jgi:nitroreductase|nr:nitroreductase family protein [Bacteroidota bacterium]MCK4408286.1 nitroreductase family protein [Bacteroidales bacterium]
MNFQELINKRQSVRKYSDKAVEKEKINRCIEAARLAPSASNSQPWKLLIVDNPELKNKVAKETCSKLLKFNKFVLEASVIIVIVLEKAKVKTRIGEKLKNKEWRLIDIGIAAEHFCLQATEEGLGTCMLGWYNENPIKKLLNIPDNKSIGLLISVGYPVKDYKLRKKIRKDIEQIVSYNAY